MQSFKKLPTMLPKNLYSNKTVLITGGATGLGFAMAKKYAALNANVLIASRKLEIVEKSVADIRESSKNENVLGFQLDVRNPDRISELIVELDSRNLFPSVIVNNAAGNILSPTEKLSNNAFNSIIDIVLKGTINTTMAFGKHMIHTERQGVFLNISTTYAKTGSAFVVPSGVAKAGCDNLVKSLAAEWGQYSIRFVGVAPGPIFTDGAFSRLDPSGNFQKQLVEKIPMKRMGDKDELANLVTYLTSDYASWMTGTIITFDGGETCSNSGEFNELLKLSRNDWRNLLKGKSTRGL